MSDPRARIEALFSLLSAASGRARGRLLLSNHLLSKNILIGDFLDRFLAARPGPSLRPAAKGLKILLGLLRNLAWVLLHGLKHAAWRLSGQRFEPGRMGGRAVCVDVYFLIPSILGQDGLAEKYFPGLYPVLEKQGLPFFFAPKFYGSHNPLALFRALRVLAREGVPVLTEYQLLRAADYLRLLGAVLAYPVALLRFMATLGPDPDQRLLHEALWDGLDQVVVSGYARSLYGRRLCRAGFQDLACISWYENQAIDRNFYAGLREVPGRVRIYGAQLFIVPSTLLFYRPDPAEVPRGVVPDRILVNGAHCPPGSLPLPVAMGPSLRYARLFGPRPEPWKAESILILLPYFESELVAVLRLAAQIRFKRPVLVKFHPATAAEAYAHLVPPGLSVTGEDVYALFHRSRLVIGASSGSLVEAAALGLPVITVDHPHKFTHNYLPDLGQGVIWERAATPAECSAALGRLEARLQDDRASLARVAQEYRATLFQRPDESGIIAAFDLTKNPEGVSTA